MIPRLLALLTLLCLAGTAAAETLDRAPFAAAIGARTVAFLARDLETGAETVLAGSDVATRHPPYSTFKIPNLLIALETGAAPSLETRRTRDPARRPAASWWPAAWLRDHTLASAFRHSVVWYFQDMAREIGTPRYREDLRRWHYGNARVPGGSDTFWIDGALRISVTEQVAFLRALLTGGLDVAPDALAALRAASRDGAVNGRPLHGKTGGGRIPGGARWGGWYVGFVERPDRLPVVFALYAEASRFGDLRAFRRAFAVTLLERVLDGTGP